MRTVYGKLVSLILLILTALLLLLPMRSGDEDHLYASPRRLRMRKGDTYAITTRLESDHAQRIDFLSMDEGVARVDAHGRVTAVNPGRTDIRMTAEDGAKTNIHVEVVGTPTTALLLNTGSITVEKGQVTGLKASFNDGADDTRLEWRSADPGIASVDAAGHVTALKGGRTRIYATSPNGLSASADVFVHVTGDAIRITPELLTVGTGARLTMGTYFLPSDTTDEVTHWSSNAPDVIAVSENGTLFAMGEGEAVLSVFTADGLSASTVVRVEPAAQYFGLNPSAVTIERGDTINLEPRFLNADGTVDTAANSHYITWASSNPATVSVKDGRIKGLRAGTARITATADGLSAECEVRVQVVAHEIRLDQESLYLLREDTVYPIRLKAELVPADPDDPSITWSSNNEMVAFVDENGTVEMTGGFGSAVITARASSGVEARFVLNVVAEMPDPNATPTVDPFATPTPVPTATPIPAPTTGGFSFDDIGNGVGSKRDIEEAENLPNSGREFFAAPDSTTAASAAPTAGGFSFNDIGNTVDAKRDITDAGIEATPTPRTNWTQENEAKGLF